MEHFVTGGTGFIGAHLVRRLIDRGDTVHALVRNPDAVTTLPDTVELVEGDVTDKESMRDGMAGCDRVFHLAGWYQIGLHDPATAYRVNVDGTRNVLELMQDLDVEKGVYTSSLAVFSDTGGDVVTESYRHDGSHLSLYDRTKWEAHYEVAAPMIAQGLPLVIVQPGAVYGPGDRGPTWKLWKPYLQGDLPIIPRQAGYCWGHVQDTADGHVRAMLEGRVGESYIIAGEPLRLVDVFAMAEDITGIPTPRSVSPALFRAMARIVAPLERIHRFPPEYSSEALRILGGVTYWGDNTKAVEELGLEHRPFRTGLGETLEAELDHLHGS